MPRANSGPKLKRGPAGKWEIHWTQGGRSRRRSTGTKDDTFAQKVFGNFLLGRGHQIDPEQADAAYMVISALGDPEEPDGDDYWHEHVLPNVIDKASARFTYPKLIGHFGHLAVCDIKPKDVDSYVSKRRRGAIGRPSVNHTISRELSVLVAAINHAVAKHRLKKVDVPVVKLPGTSQARDRWLTEPEADRLLAAAAAYVDPRQPKDKVPRVHLFVALALNTASRKCALLEMRWTQVDLENGLIYLNPKGRAQTNKRRPQVPISDELRPLLERADRENRNAKGERISNFVLGGGASIRTAFGNAVARANLGRDVTPHVLRHTWATWAAQGGTSMFDIAGVLGDTVKTVTDTYAHHSPEHLRKAVNNVRPSVRRQQDERMAA